MEVTFDPQAGGAFVSQNGQPLETPQEALEAPVEEMTSLDDYLSPESSQEPTQELIEEEDVDEEETDELDDLSADQQAAVSYWEKFGFDAVDALKWTDTEECPLSDESYHRLGDLLNDSNSDTVELSMGLIALAKRKPDFFDFDDTYAGVDFNQEQEHALVDEIGGEHTSEIINLNFKLKSGEMSRDDAIRYVSARPKLRNAYFKAACKGLLLIHL